MIGQLERLNLPKVYASTCLIDHGIYTTSVHPICLSSRGQNGHSPVSRTSSISTTPSESFRQFKVSVTTKYGQLPSQGIPERSLTSLWKAFIPVPPCSSDPFANFSPHHHLRFKSFPSSKSPVYHRQIGNIGEQGIPIPLCRDHNNALLLSPVAQRINIRDYSTFPDNINVSRLRGDGT